MKSKIREFLKQKCVPAGRNLFLFLLATTALVSCGSDDNEGGSKRPTLVSLQGGTESIQYTMSYDDKGRLGSMTSNAGGAHTFTFAYNEKGKVSNVTTSGAVTDPISFTYNEQGKLATFARGNQAPFVVNWVDATTLTIDGTTIKVDSKNDLVMYDVLSITRDSGKGAFSGVKGVDGLTMLLIETQTLFFASKKPVKTILGSGGGYILANSFQGGMVSGATFDISGTPYTMTISY
ncbi:hypothetical protein [Flavobacterium selenitireducens]|uniref:hypothetical protein n=1 Tax=Flavobacterium selenitireducens TaxID=2722704 RepID=UPI00168ACBF2|nr:hypothetical protein [Flavobacterium selenitireducens]MBD3582648.1 hypothetical protein [Flavobacterium selenitireducens]